MRSHYYSANQITDEVPRPLRGYIESFRSGAVPDWVVAPTCSRKELRELLRQMYDGHPVETNGGIPDGVRAVPYSARSQSAGDSLLEFEVSPGRYLELHRGAHRRSDEETHVRLTVPVHTRCESDRFAYGQRPPVPEKIAERIANIEQTAGWEEKTGILDFNRWVLTYRLGGSSKGKDANRPITDVAIEAVFH